MRSACFNKIFLMTVFLLSFLSVNAQVSETEPNDFFATANPVDISSGNLSISGAINPVGDLDKFTFNVPSHRFIRFETFDSSGNGCANAMDTIIRIYDSNQVPLASDDDAGIGNCSNLGFGLAPGNYFIQVEEFGNNNLIAGYQLKITLSQFEIEPNDSSAQADASTLQISDSIDIQGTENPPNEFDYFRINNPTPANFNIKTSNYTGTTCFATSAVGIDVLDANQVIRFSGVTNLCPTLNISLPTGVFYLRADPFITDSAPFNTYLIQITRTPTTYVSEYEPNGTFTDANLNLIQINSSMDISGSINPAADSDRFRVNLTQGANVTFETFSDNQGTVCDVDTVIRLFNSAGTELINDDDGGINNCSLILNTNLPPGTYFIQVEAFGINSTIPTYLLRTTITPDTPPTTPRFDFDGDGKSDVSIFRPDPGEWWYLRSSDGGNRAFQFGNSTDQLTPGDYTGDGQTDIAFWRPSTGEWFILRSEDASFYSFPFGANGDIPVPADYDGDGKADAAVFRPSTTTWFIQKSSGGTLIFNFGAPTDKPVVADYDGDGKADAAIWRAEAGEWWYQKSSDGQIFAFQFGVSTDRPAAGDYTGDGKADVAFWRPATGEWFVLRSEDSSFYSFPFGASGDIPVTGDYDGDGKTDAAVFRPANTTWFLNRSTAGVEIIGFGAVSDVPVPSVFIP